MPRLDPTVSVPSVPLQSQPTGTWSVAGAIAFVVLVLAITMLAGLAMQNWLQGAHPAVEPADGLTQGNPRVFVRVQLAGQLLEVALIWALVGIWHTDRARALDLAPVHLSAAGWAGVVALLFAVKVLATAVAAAIGTANPKQELQPFLELARQTDVWLLFLLAVGLAGITEELLFRAVLSRTLEATRLGFWLGAGLANGAFALLHVQYGAGGQFVIFGIGMTLAWIRARTASLWPAIVCHALNNVVAVLAMRALL